MSESNVLQRLQQNPAGLLRKNECSNGVTTTRWREVKHIPRLRQTLQHRTEGLERQEQG